MTMLVYTAHAEETLMELGTRTVLIGYVLVYLVYLKQ